MMAGEGKNIIDVFIKNIMESLSRLRLEKMVVLLHASLLTFSTSSKCLAVTTKSSITSHKFNHYSS